MGREGALNQFLQKLGVVDGPIEELGFSNLSVRLAMVQLYILFMVTPLFFVLAQVDRSAPQVDLSTSHYEDGTVRAHWQPCTPWGFPPAGAIETRWRCDEGAWSHWCRKREITLPIEKVAESVAVGAR